MTRRGFTLLEMLVATLIMGIAVVGLLSSISTSLRHAGSLAERERATALAKRKMDELLVEPRLPRQTLLEGRFDPAAAGGVEAGWRARLTPFEIPPQVVPGISVLDRLELEVWWMSGQSRRSLSMEGFRRYVLRPQDTGGAGGQP